MQILLVASFDFFKNNYVVKKYSTSNSTIKTIKQDERQYIDGAIPQKAPVYHKISPLNLVIH